MCHRFEGIARQHDALGDDRRLSPVPRAGDVAAAERRVIAFAGFPAWTPLGRCPPERVSTGALQGPPSAPGALHLHRRGVESRVREDIFVLNALARRDRRHLVPGPHPCKAYERGVSRFGPGPNERPKMVLLNIDRQNQQGSGLGYR